VRSQGAERVGSEERGGFPYGSQPASHCDEVISRCRMGDAESGSAGQPTTIGRAAYRQGSLLPSHRTYGNPFNTGCSPLSYSGNPGASGVSYSGAVYLAAAGHAQNARSCNRSLAGTGKGRTLSWPSSASGATTRARMSLSVCSDPTAVWGSERKSSAKANQPAGGEGRRSLKTRQHPPPCSDADCLCVVRREWRVDTTLPCKIRRVYCVYMAWLTRRGAEICVHCPSL
jgi:hypothetical protein